MPRLLSPRRLMLACMTDAVDMTPTEHSSTVLSLDDRYACYVVLHHDDCFA